jgi:hypothetical protein
MRAKVTAPETRGLECESCLMRKVALVFTAATFLACGTSSAGATEAAKAVPVC